MLPAFHHERVQAARGVMEEEIERALAPWHDGLELDLYAWARELALRVAMRALFGFDPDARRRRRAARRASSSARSASTAASTGCRCCAGPARRGGADERARRASTA